MTLDVLQSFAGESLTVERQPDPCEPLLYVRGTPTACQRLAQLAKANALPDIRLVTAARCVGEVWCVVLGIWQE